MKTRLISLLLCLTLVLSICPKVSLAISDKRTNDGWTINNGCASYEETINSANVSSSVYTINTNALTDALKKGQNITSLGSIKIYCDIQITVKLDLSSFTSITSVNSTCFELNKIQLGIFLPPSIKKIGKNIIKNSDGASKVNIGSSALNTVFEGDNKYDSELTFTGASESTAKYFFTKEGQYVVSPLKVTSVKVRIGDNDVFLYTGASAEKYGGFCTVDTPSQYGSLFEGYYFKSYRIFDANGRLDKENAKNALSIGLVNGSELTPKIKQSDVTVTYNSDGSIFQKDTVKYGDYYTITKKEPQKSGFSFKGWALSPTATQEDYYSGQPISEVKSSLYLYAVWGDLNYTIHYDANGGDYAPSDATVSHENLIGEGVKGSTAMSATRNGYTLMGWSTTPTGKEITSYSDIEKYITSSRKITLYAVWANDTYDVHYYIDNKLVKTETYKTDDEKFLYKPVINGATFDGWSKSAGATTSDYGTTTPQKNINNGAKSINLYAVIKRHSYTLKFEPYDNMDSGTMTSMVAQYTETITIPSCNYTRNGYNFVGWSKTKTMPLKGESVPVDFQAGDKVKELVKEDGGSLTLYPVWNAGGYSITYLTMCDDAVNWPSAKRTVYNYGESFTLPTPTREGYAFLGWQDESGNMVTSINTTDTGAKTFTAVWKPRSLMVHFEGGHITDATIDDKVVLQSKIDTSNNDYATNATINNITMIVENGIMLTNVQVIDSTNEVIQSKYQLNGQTVNLSLNNYQMKGDIYIYADGEPKTFNITYDLDGGTFNGEYDKTYVFGTKKTLPTNVVKDGFALYGWAMPNGKVVNVLPDTTMGDITLKAIYSAESYHTVIDLSGGTTSDDRFVNGKAVFDFKFNSGEIELPSDVKKEGSEFLGWYDGTTLSYITYIDTSFPADHMIYAVFTANNNIGFISNVIKNSDNEETYVIDEKNDKIGYYYYSLLTDYEQRIYTALQKAYRFNKETEQANNSSIELVGDEEVSREKALNVCAAFCKDHPEIFWIRYFTSSEATKDEAGKYHITVKPMLAYRVEVAASDILEFNAYYEYIVSNMKADDADKLDDIAKVEYVNNYICENFSYRNYSNILSAKTSNETRSVGYFLAHKEGCCEAYAKLTMLMLRELGIDAITVTSTDHMWNQVKINGEWYLQDTTWNDKGKSSVAKYLLIGNTKSDKHHKTDNYFYLESEAGEDGSASNVKPVITYGKFDAPKLAKKNCGTVKVNGITYRYLNKSATIVDTSKGKISYTIPKSVKINKKQRLVKVIPANMFGKNVKVIRIYANIKKVEKNAFKRINKKATIKIFASKAQKNRISKLIKQSGLANGVNIK